MNFENLHHHDIVRNSKN